MKAKHRYLFSIACILLAIGITVVYYASDFWSIDNTVPGRRDIQPLPVYPEPSPMEIRLIDQLSPKLEMLRHPPVQKKTPSDLRLLGFVTQSPGATGFFRAKQTNRQNITDFLLSFTFSSGKRRFCVIDGVFYQEGDYLPDESRIFRVAARKVLLEKNGLQSWIHIPARSDAQPQVPESGSSRKQSSAKEKT
jgi:hypothetical protein